MTHLSASEDPSGTTTQTQLQLFRGWVDSYGLERSVANSAAVASRPETHLEWVRPGLMLYGISPLAEQSAASIGLRPAMTLVTQLIAVREAAEGEGVGYNSIWRAPKATPIGILAIGYGDGYPRGVRAGTPVLLHGQEVPIVGRVSMDMIAVDLSGVPEASVGDEVVMWGPRLPVERIAQCAGTIAYELVCRVKERVSFVWTDE